MIRPALLPLLFSACGFWPVSQTITLDDELWDTNVVSIDDGTYVILPRAGQLVRVGTDDTWHPVDLNGARPISIRADGSYQRVMVHSQWPICDDPAPNIVLVEDCAEDDLYWGTEMAIIDSGKQVAVSSVPAHMNGMAFTPDGDTAVVYMDRTAESHAVTGPIVDLTEIMFLDLNTGETESLSIGFPPRKILFTKDGQTSVILSQSHVLVIDMDTREVQTEYPLALDADIEVEPSGAALSPDERYVLLTIQDRSDLYKLDLEVVSIDMEALDGVASDIANDDATEATVLVYEDRSQVDIIVEHDFIERESLPLDEPASEVITRDGMAILFNNERSDSRDIIKLDLDSFETTEYVVDNPIRDLQISPDGHFAVATLKPSIDTDYGGLGGYQRSNWGLAVADLHTDDVVSLVLESKPVGVELVEQDDNSFALVLLEDLEEVLQVNLATPGQYAGLNLPSPPASIRANPSGGFTIAHKSALGQISHLDPAEGSLDTTGGFAVVDFFKEDRLPRRTTSKPNEG